MLTCFLIVFSSLSNNKDIWLVFSHTVSFSNLTSIEKTYKQPQGPRKKLGFIRYIVFALALILVLLLFHYGKANKHTMFLLFLVGNLVYYVAGILLAVLFKDNRAFCKYICPITVFLKPMSYFSLLRIHCDESKCVHCGKCLKVCPMEVEVNNNSRKRKNATECILCQKCKKECPVKALK